MHTDPDSAATPDSGLYGLDDDPANAGVVVLPVPFDATCSYRRAAAEGPAAILAASHQVELLDVAFGEPWRAGIAMLPQDERDVAANTQARELADRARSSADAPAPAVHESWTAPLEQEVIPADAQAPDPQVVGWLAYSSST